jgi:UDP-2-acetamido-2-deoxy-ribo-hexuluronate aminotransferase
MIPFIDLRTQYESLKPQLHERIQRVLDHGHYIMGPEVRELEAALASYTGAKHCITVASGTDALLISLMALGIGPGDEVMTSPFSFVAPVEVIVLAGATPIFVDVEPDTGNIDVHRIEAAITQRTRAIMPVSLYGQASDMDAINAIASRHGLSVIEDAAQSFGAEYRGKKSGNLSTIGCTSFYPSKPLGCYGDGGAIFTSDDRLAVIAREIREHGQGRRYVHTRVGIGGRMDTLQCAIVLAKLERFAWELAQRSALGQRYNSLFDQAGVARIQYRPDRTCAFAQYTVLVDARDRLQAVLNEAGIPAAIHYPAPLNRQPAYSHFGPPDGCAVADELADRVLSLPMSAYLSPADQARIVTLVASHASGFPAPPQHQ